MQETPLPVPGSWFLCSSRVQNLRLEVKLASGCRHVVRHPENWCVQPFSGRVLLYPEVGPFEVQIEPGEVVGLRPAW